MFERFTDRARRVVVLAQEEARVLNHNYIGTEHLLLGLIREDEGIAAKALEALDVSLEQVREQVVEIVGHGDKTPTGHVPFTPRGKKVLELSLREALQMGHNYIGTEHILLGLVREGEGVAAQVLQSRGVTLPIVREHVLEILSGQPAESAVGGLEEEGDTFAEASRGAGGFIPGRSRPAWLSRRRRATGPRQAACPGCGSDVGESAAYRVHAVPAHDGDGVRDVLFVYCAACGTTLTGQVIPEDDDIGEDEPGTEA